MALAGYVHSLWDAVDLLGPFLHYRGGACGLRSSVMGIPHPHLATSFP